MRQVFFVALLVAILASCGAQPASQNSASQSAAQSTPQAAEEETTETASSGEVSVVEETTPAPVVAAVPEPAPGTATSPATGSSGMVTTASPYATQAGLEILDEGGNAFDAAVAVAAALGVAEPMMSGIGGYGAIVIYDAEEGETRFLDTGSRTPEALDPEVFRSGAPNFVDNRCGIRSVTTPGNANAWETMSRDYGELEWRRLFDPAIGLAEEGVVLDGITAGWIDAAWPAFPENARAIYSDGGVPLGTGDTLVQEELANSLRLIRDEGAETLYGGELGEAIDATMRENGGFLSIDDLRDNRATWRDTVSADYRGYEVVTSSPPSTSWGALVRLGVMGQFGFEPADHNSTPYLHTFTEISKQAGRATRDYVTDPEIADTPLDLLLSEEFWAEQASLVNPNVASPNPPFGQFGTPTRCIPQSYATPSYAPAATPNDIPTGLAGEQQGGAPGGGGHTTHFVVADSEGNVVSATQTLGNIFGSKVMPEGTGIWLNDALAWSRFEPVGNVFDVYSGRQSLYALCPTIVMSDGKPWVALGTPGGRTIQQTTPQMLANIIDFGMDVQQAVSVPRVSTTNPNALVVEAGIPVSTRAGLAALGHNVLVDERGLGNAHGLTIEYDAQGNPDRFTGGADPRGVGAAAGL